MNEKHLIRQSQKGEHKAFDQLIRMYYPYVTKFLIKTTCNEDLSQDLCQETFLKMIKNIEKFDVNCKSTFGTWLITIAKNNYLDYLRRSKYQAENIDDLQLVAPDDVLGKVLLTMEYEELLQALQQLPKEQGNAIRMKYVEQMTLAEIAKEFNVQPKTIKSRIYDGKAKLKKIFEKSGRTG